MAVDYLSALNSKGSGLNITQLVDSLTAAEVEPSRARITDSKEKIELSISEIGKLRAEMENLRSIFAVENAGIAFDVTSSSAAVAVEISDLGALENRTASVEVSAIASSQVLEFEGFTSADQTLGEGSLSIAFGTWSGSSFTADAGRAVQTVTLTGNALGLDDLAAKLSAINGVSAQVVAKGDGSYSLAVMSETGAANALRIAADAPLGAFDTTDGSHETLSARDAALTVDGISVTRSANRIDDLLPGLTLTLTATTGSPATITARENAELAEAELKTFVESLNTMRSALRDSLKRGINGAGSGPLAADPAVMSLSRSFAALTTTPLEGFGADPVYLSNLGVRTERDGTLSVDSDTFQAAMARDPAQYRAVFQSLDRVSASGFALDVAGYATPPAGAYNFVVDANGLATLNGEAMIARTVDGVSEFYKLTGDFGGVTLRVSDPFPTSATVYFGNSLLDRVRDFVDQSLASSGGFATRTSIYEQDMREQNDMLDELTTSETRIRERYMAKFGAMESVVTQLKNTGEYLTNMLEAWKQSRN
ncbi:MAG: flagellar filament capping protein FliD [Marivivens sp.]